MLRGLFRVHEMAKHSSLPLLRLDVGKESDLVARVPRQERVDEFVADTQPQRRFHQDELGETFGIGSRHHLRHDVMQVMRRRVGRIVLPEIENDEELLLLSQGEELVDRQAALRDVDVGVEVSLRIGFFRPRCSGVLVQNRAVLLAVATHDHLLLVRQLVEDHVLEFLHRDERSILLVLQVRLRGCEWKVLEGRDAGSDAFHIVLQSVLQRLLDGREGLIALLAFSDVMSPTFPQCHCMLGPLHVLIRHPMIVLGHPPVRVGCACRTFQFFRCELCEDVLACPLLLVVRKWGIIAAVQDGLESYHQLLWFLCEHFVLSSE
mmetsp:Transcript_19909/g.55344  ORF Transcript_19909/g.55344 Transcript_19909/m.55344 type:complete len:320 (-) Transcript_19909:360-1319(-)